VEREIHAAARPELVWTGPETPGAGSRDTSVVVEELLRSAERSVLVATYAVYKGAEVFAALAERMEALPDLSVRLFLNIARPAGCPANVSEAQVVRAFAERFVGLDWPAGVRLPELFYDPRSLSAEPGPKACLHAKCIVVDGSRAFVTSANFTEAAQERNIETGLLVDDPHLARALRDQFESLVTAGQLRRVPGMP
jgi:phosphatidylserine/phosphatidylglycerophosphate/cardiolipin synthase-like enzyme